MQVSKIRWQKGDYITLGKAVAEFNKKIDKLEQMEGLGYLPEKISYQETKSKIYSRKELNRIVNSLKRFQKEGAEDLVITQAGTFITKWENQQLKQQSKIAIARINEELSSLSTPKEGAKYSFAQMGISRVAELERMKEKIESLRTEKDPEEFTKKMTYVRKIGTYDFARKMAEVYRKNYMTMIESTYKNFDNFDKFKEKLESIKDPTQFYKFLKNNEKLSDIAYMYDLARVGVGGASTQDTFNELLKNIGIDIDERRKIKGYSLSSKTFTKSK